MNITAAIEIIILGACIIMCAFVPHVVVFFRKIFSLFGRWRVEQLKKYFDDSGKNLITRVSLISLGAAFIIIGLAVLLGLKK